VHAETLEVVDACRSLGTEHLRGGAAHEAAPGALGVGAVTLRAVVAGQCGGQPSLGPVAVWASVVAEIRATLAPSAAAQSAA
jgi:hypothetical protein